MNAHSSRKGGARSFPPTVQCAALGCTTEGVPSFDDEWMALECVLDGSPVPVTRYFHSSDCLARWASQRAWAKAMRSIDVDSVTTGRESAFHHGVRAGTLGAAPGCRDDGCLLCNPVHPGRAGRSTMSTRGPLVLAGRTYHPDELLRIAEDLINWVLAGQPTSG